MKTNRAEVRKLIARLNKSFVELHDFSNRFFATRESTIDPASTRPLNGPILNAKANIEQALKVLEAEADDITVSPEAASLLLYEVMIVQIGRRRENWNDKDPGRSLGIEDLDPGEVIPFALEAYLKFDKFAIRAIAEEVLDILVAQKKAVQ